MSRGREKHAKDMSSGQYGREISEKTIVQFLKKFLSNNEFLEKQIKKSK